MTAYNIIILLTYFYRFIQTAYIYMYMSIYIYMYIYVYVYNVYIYDNKRGLLPISSTIYLYNGTYILLQHLHLTCIYLIWLSLSLSLSLSLRRVYWLCSTIASFHTPLFHSQSHSLYSALIGSNLYFFLEAQSRDCVRCPVYK